jgi:hypothetical protein
MTTAKSKKRTLKLDRVFAAIDCKDRSFLNRLNDDERKEFNAYISMRWAAGIEGSYEEQVYYLRSVNERVNFNFFDISRHPKLQWLLCTTASPNIGTFRHYWIGSKTKTNGVEKFIEAQFPHLNDNEIALMAANLSIAELRDYARSLGWDEKEIQKAL